MPGQESSSPPSKSTVFLRRSASTVLLWGLVAAAFASMRPWAYLGLISLLALIATAEYFRMLRAAGVPSFPRFGMLMAAGYLGALSWHFLRGGGEWPAAADGLALFLAAAGAFKLQLRHEIRGKDPLVAVAATLLGFVYIPFLFGFAARLVFAVPGEGALPGAWLLLWLVAVTKFTDMGAYLTGSLIGRHKMIPHVSPGKTWEGFAGALLFAQLAACGLYALMPGPLAVLQGWGHVLALGFLLAMLAVVGDLAESVVKRSLDAKDSGRMLPGIGGSLDLIDSLCFTAPALFFYLVFVLHVSP